MRQFLSAILIFVFVLWILPLGVFIKQSQEEKACNGQRAICLCSHLFAKANIKSMVHVSLKVSGTPEKERSAGGSSHHFLNQSIDSQVHLRNILLSKENSFLYTCQFYHTIEHVPKTQSSYS